VQNPTPGTRNFGLGSQIHQGFLEFLRPKKTEHGIPWGKTFYCFNRSLLVGSLPQKISKKLFWGQIFPRADVAR
jgi:hypothetical protein